ncbi:MAG: class I SAM-dependent methyltransferase [Candidatus Parcubacteria bacterium]|nr:class I SAM-dependent methyltransferase [Candidatus Parcubacteria bacterium]
MLCKICQNKTKLIFTAVILKKFTADYFHCPFCKAVQTSEPKWLKEAYSDAITKQDTGLISRNIACARLTLDIAKKCFNPKKRFLDYAGGYGMLVRLMRDGGLDFYLYDQYCQNLFAKDFGIEKLSSKKDRYELITAFEVFEHLVDPMTEIEEIFCHTDSILFSTTLLPKDKEINQKWNYLGLDHGQHIFFYSKKTLEFIAKKFHKNLYTDGKNFHLITSKKFLINPLWFYMISPTVIYRRIWNKLSTILKWKPIPRMNHYELRPFKSK